MTCFDHKAYWENRLSRHYNVRGVGYLDLGRHYNAWLYRIRRSVFLRLMRSCRMGFRTCRVLDVGAGTGFYIDRWEELGAHDITAIDITTTAVARLKERYPHHRFRQLDISEDASALAGGPFDVISCMDVLFHIVDDDRHRRAMENIHSLLRPGGLVVFSNHFVHGRTHRPAPHVVARSLADEQRILDDLGFEIVARRPMFVLMNAPVDTESERLRRFWDALEGTVSHTRGAGFLLGAVLYPLERLLVSLYDESPTTEIMLCRKGASRGSLCVSPA